MNKLLTEEAVDLLREDEFDQSVVMTDPSHPDNPIVYITEKFVYQTGYTEEEVLGRNCRFLQGEETDPQDRRAIRDAIAARREVTVDILNYRKDGSSFWNRLRIRPLYDERGNLLYFVGLQNPVKREDVRRFPSEGIRD